MLCQSQVYSKVIHSYIYSLFFRFFSHIDYHRILSRVPCAIPQVLFVYLSYIQQCVCVCSSQDSFCFVFFCLLYRFVVDFLKQNKHYKIPADLRSMNGHFSKITSREHTQNYFKHFNMSSSEMVEIKVKHFCQLKEYLFIEIILVKQS